MKLLPNMEANEKNKHHHGVSTRVNAEAELAITFSTSLFTVIQERKVNKLPGSGSLCQHLARECLQSNQQDHTGDTKWGIDHYVIKLYLFFILF